jgi:hypothetical protein
MTSNDDAADSDLPATMPYGKVLRGGLNVVGGAIPFFGGLFSAAAGAWSEAEQERVNRFIRHWLKMMEAEMAEKQQTVIEIMQRLDMHDEEIAKRVSSDEYQSLLRKGFRDWAGAESEEKRILIRNVLANAGATQLTSDDVIRLFLEWIKTYSELHFSVVAKIYNNSGITRGEVWAALGRSPVREDSADADLFRLLFRDLSTGGIVRQHRETDYAGNFIRKTPTRRPAQAGGPRAVKSAFDDEDGYELTQLGQQFVHYAMTDLPLKLNYQPTDGSGETPIPAGAEAVRSSAEAATPAF